MDDENRYGSLEVGILWHKKGIGWVLNYLGPKSTVLMVDWESKSHNATIDGRQGLAPSSVVNITNNVGAIDESRVKVIWKPFDVDFSSLYDVFIFIIKSLAVLAAHVTSDRVEK